MRKLCFHAGLFLVGMTTAAFLVSAAAAADDPSTPPPPGNAGGDVAGMEVMMRGPIHEAFAQPVNSGAVNQLVVSKKPPQAIEEIPPDEKPADENTMWIGGYWAWDDGRQDFDWVSGVWRVPPPNQRWVAGYWTAANGGYSWVPGFWTAATADNVVYNPEPPASLEQGPTNEQPSPSDIWIPGCWRWVNLRYAWQPGYWAAAQPNWVWTPASYCWSPRGWIFCSGYWDYLLDRRGLLFAPVAFTRPVFSQVGYAYSPSVVIDSGLLTSYLFVRPNCSQYYFGDYYAANYDKLGVYPWFAVGSYRGYAYDPLFSFYAWRNIRRNPNWVMDLKNSYANYRAHPEQRLPQTWAAVRQASMSPGNRANRQFLQIANTLQDLRKNPASSIRLAAVSPQQRATFQQTAGLMRQFGGEREKMEMTTARGRLAGPNAVTTLKTPQTLRFPQVARTLNERTNDQTSGNTRQTMKPILTPSSPELRSETILREARNPVIQTQPTTKGTGTAGFTERKIPAKSTQERRPLGGTESSGPIVEKRNVPPPTSNTGRSGTQSPPKGNNRDNERRLP